MGRNMLNFYTASVDSIVSCTRWFARFSPPFEQFNFFWSSSNPFHFAENSAVNIVGLDSFIITVENMNTLFSVELGAFAAAEAVPDGCAEGPVGRQEAQVPPGRVQARQRRGEVGAVIQVCASSHRINLYRSHDVWLTVDSTNITVTMMTTQMRRRL